MGFLGRRIWQAAQQPLTGPVFRLLGGGALPQGGFQNPPAATGPHQHHPAACFGMEQLDVELQLA